MPGKTNIEKIKEKLKLLDQDRQDLILELLEAKDTIVWDFVRRGLAEGRNETGGGSSGEGDKNKGAHSGEGLEQRASGVLMLTINFPWPENSFSGSSVGA